MTAFTAAPRPGLQIARVILSTLEVAMFFWAVSYLPLADTVTFYLAGPIYVTALSVLLLGEKVGWRRWTAVLIGFVGVVIALRPSAASFTLPALIALIGSLCFAVLIVATRLLHQTSNTVLVTGQITGTLIFGILLAPFGWVTPSWPDFLLLTTFGLISMVALACVNYSLKITLASVVAPYQYTFILWAITLGYVVFGDVPDAIMLAGAAIIIAAGLYIFWREQSRAADAATASTGSLRRARRGSPIKPSRCRRGSGLACRLLLQPSLAIETEAVARHLHAAERAHARERNAGPDVAALLQHAARGRIAHPRAGLQRLMAEFIERIRDHRARDFGRVAAAPIRHAEPIADLRISAGEQAHAAPADQRAVAQRHQQGRLIVRTVQPVDERLGILARVGIRRARQVLRNAAVVDQRHQRRHVIEARRAQDEPLRFQHGDPAIRRDLGRNSCLQCHRTGSKSEEGSRHPVSPQETRWVPPVRWMPADLDISPPFTRPLPRSSA